MHIGRLEIVYPYCTLDIAQHPCVYYADIDSIIIRHGLPMPNGWVIRICMIYRCAQARSSLVTRGNLATATLPNQPNPRLPSKIPNTSSMRARWSIRIAVCTNCLSPTLDRRQVRDSSIQPVKFAKNSRAKPLENFS